ncbi:MAG TPA: peptide ABC transporter substrate-binding protein [Bacteroidia bacterium]|nr:peptide ABC transporter substrate-binding protein [Bacteroidia bacterium]
MRRILFFLPVLMIVASCNNDNPADNTPKEGKGGRVYGGTLKFNETDKFQTLFPTLITDAISSHIATQIYEGLVKFDPRTLKVVPSIASTWDIDTSGTIYTFHLRKDVKFQDDPCFTDGKGRLVTADDVLYSLELLCKNDGMNQNFGSTFKGRVVGANEFYDAGANAKPGSIEGIKKIDAQTVQIKLVAPQISFLYIMANPSASVVPKEAVDKYGDKMHVGTGPFTLATIANDSSTVVLVRNNNYYAQDSFGNQLPFLDSIKVSFIDNKKAELDLFQQNQLDFVWGLSAEAVKTFVPQVISEFEQKPPKFLLDHSSEFVTQIYSFNTTKPPFDNLKVRQAFSYAIDRSYIVDEVLAGEAYGPGVNGICPPALPGYKGGDVKGYEQQKESADDNKKQKEADRELAKKLLAEAGYPGGKNFPSVKLVLNSGGSRYTRVAEEIQNELRDVLGVNIEIANVSFQQKLNDEKYGRADIFRSAWVADYPSAESFLSLFYGADVPDSLSSPSFPNTSRYKNPEFDRLYDLGRGAKTIEQSNSYFLQAEQLMMQDAPAIILWYDENYRLTQYRVKNFFTNPMRMLDFSQVYLKDEPKKDDKKDSTGGTKSDAEDQQH